MKLAAAVWMSAAITNSSVWCAASIVIGGSLRCLVISGAWAAFAALIYLLDFVSTAAATEKEPPHA